MSTIAVNAINPPSNTLIVGSKSRFPQRGKPGKIPFK
jgi:hypothetical protein